MTTRELTVRAISPAAEDVLVVELVSATGGPLPPWQPGAHIEVDLGRGLTRQYSLCGDPAQSEVWTIAVLLNERGRGGSRWFHERLRIGDRLSCAAIRNRFELPPSSRYLFLAGGIGITPILPMLALAESRGAQWSLVYTAGVEARLLWIAELGAAWGERVQPHLSRVSGRLDVDELVEGTAEATVIVCCGPVGLAAKARQAAERIGRRIVTEAFEAEPAVPTGPDSDHAFVVELAQSGGELAVDPGQTVLEVLERAGVPVPSSCREGYCGTCESIVLDGEVDHRDTVMTPDEHEDTDLMMVCVSRCKGRRLRLDL